MASYVQTCQHLISVTTSPIWDRHPQKLVRELHFLGSVNHQQNHLLARKQIVVDCCL